MRRPRLDQVLDKAAGKFARKDGRLYHYLLAAPHVLLLPVGVVVLVAKYQSGRISAKGDHWTQGGIGMRRFFGREGLGNPTREAEAQVAKMVAMIREDVYKRQVWVTACARETQMARLRVCRGLSEAAAAARIDAQSPQADKIARADVVITTDGLLRETEEQFVAAWGV